jgi:hypothetical protein
MKNFPYNEEEEEETDWKSHNFSSKMNHQKRYFSNQPPLTGEHFYDAL